MQSCFTTEVRALARHLSGNKNYPLGKEGDLVLISRDVSSLVVDRLCDQARGQSTAVACFYFDFAARKEQSATSMLGSLLKQVVGGMEKLPEEILQASNGHEGVVKILLGREEVNPDKSDRFGQTPLSYAAGGGHERVVALLQSRKPISPRTI